MSMGMVMMNKSNILLPKSTHFIAKTLPLQHVLSTPTSINFLSPNQHQNQNQCQCQCVSFLETYKSPCRGLHSFFKPISAVGSGFKDSLSDAKGKEIVVKNAKIIVESQDDDKIQVRVELKGENTQKIYDKALTELARSAPPVPGFRKQKGGKPSKTDETTFTVPKSVLQLIIGKDRVSKFVIQEIVSSTMADYVKKENQIKTTQSSEELKSLFKPGSDFGFNAILDLVNSED